MPIRQLMMFAVLAAMLAPSTAAAAARDVHALKAQPTCTLPESDADALVILSNDYPGYWWDHTDLTIAVQAHPKATRAQVAAIREAIATWSEVLNDCFGGRISLTAVTGTQPSEQRAAGIVVHFVPHAGGAVCGGFAVCGAHGCPNVLVGTETIGSLSRGRPR